MNTIEKVSNILNGIKFQLATNSPENRKLFYDNRMAVINEMIEEFNNGRSDYSASALLNAYKKYLRYKPEFIFNCRWVSMKIQLEILEKSLS